MSPIKEPHFFAEEMREGNFDSELRRRITSDARGLREFLDGPMIGKRFGGIVTNWADYVRLFANAHGQLAVGEASACYLWSPTAAERIAARIPDAKILVMLRDPAERAFSQYLHGIGNGSIRWTFREHIQRNRLHRSGQLCIHYPFLEFGFYAEQICRFMKWFGRNVWVGFYEDFRSCPLNLYQDICQFLGVAQDFYPDMERRHMEAEVPRVVSVGWLKRSGVWQSAALVTPSSLRPLIRRALMRRAEKTRIDPADRRYLHDFYREDIQKLASLLGRDLDEWLRPH